MFWTSRTVFDCESDISLSGCLFMAVHVSKYSVTRYLLCSNLSVKICPGHPRIAYRMKGNPMRKMLIVVKWHVGLKMLNWMLFIKVVVGGKKGCCPDKLSGSLATMEERYYNKKIITIMINERVVASVLICG